MANASSPPTRERTINKLDPRIDTSPGNHASGELGETPSAPILVLSRYPALIETVRKAASRGVPVVPIPDVEQATLKVRSLNPGILIIDMASTSDVASLVVELTAIFPRLVIVVAGQRDDSAALMKLTASGQIFRFLLVPLSHGQTRLTLEAATTERKRLIAAATRVDERKPAEKAANKSDITGYVAFAVGIALSAGGIWWFTSRTNEPPAPVAAVTTTTAPAKSTVASQPDPLESQLALAQTAFARGEYVEPAGKSALDYYRSALRIDPTNTPAQTGIRNVADKILERAEAALTAQKTEEAVTAIEAARAIDPQHPRLAFLDALVASERNQESQAQDLSRKIESLIAKAQELTKRGRLVASPGDKATDKAAGNARDTLLEARRLDPTNAEVAQGLRELSQALAEEANRMIQAGNLDKAQSFLTSARQLGIDDGSLAAIASALTDARNSIAASRQTRPAPAPAAPAPIPPADTLAMSRAPEPARAQTNEPPSAARNGSSLGNGTPPNQVERPPTDTSSNTSGDANSIVPVASLRRIRTVEPVYPIAARRRKETGMVEVLFTVTPDGGVENVEVRNSTPEVVFDEAAKKAVEQWRFDPVRVNGQAVAQRVSARLRFSLD